MCGMFQTALQPSFAPDSFPEMSPHCQLTRPLANHSCATSCTGSQPQQANPMGTLTPKPKTAVPTVGLYRTENGIHGPPNYRVPIKTQ